MSRSKHFKPGEVVECVPVSTSSIADRDWEPAVYWSRPTSDMPGWHWVKRVKHNAFGDKILVPARRVRAWSSRTGYPSTEDVARLSPTEPSGQVSEPEPDHALAQNCRSSLDVSLPVSDSVAAVLQAVGSMVASAARLDDLELARRKK